MANKDKKEIWTDNPNDVWEAVGAEPVVLVLLLVVPFVAVPFVAVPLVAVTFVAVPLVMVPLGPDPPTKAHPFWIIGPN